MRQDPQNGLEVQARCGRGLAYLGFGSRGSGRAFCAEIRDECADHITKAAPFRAGGKTKRHTVLEDRLGKCNHILLRWGQSAAQKRAGTHGQHQRLGGAWSGSPTDGFFDHRVSLWLIRARCANQIKNGLKNGLTNRDPADGFLRLD